MSLGTFEFLVNPLTAEYYFLEVNPRLQVEHTITESIAGVDLVQMQLLIAQGAATLEEVGLRQAAAQLETQTTPSRFSLQLRITAEDVARDYSLCVGKIVAYHFPSGNGVRVDTHLVQGIPAVVSADFDSLIAKLIVTAPTWHGVLRKASRALEDVRVTGVQTNIDMLRAIVAHADFAAGRNDTGWLERDHQSLLGHIRAQARKPPSQGLFEAKPTMTSLAPSMPLFRKGTAWTVSLQPKSIKTPDPSTPTSHLEIARVLRNDFPTTFFADVVLTHQDSASQMYSLHLQSTSAFATTFGSHHRLGSFRDPTHVVIPFSGKLVELDVEVGDTVKQGDVVCVVKQMKMELEVRASRAGVVTWVTELEDDEDVAEGMLAAVVEDGKGGAKL